MRGRRCAIAALLAGSCIAARAEDMAVDAQVWPYTAIGKLNVVLGANRRSFCSAALIGPRLVLTAAHCLWDAPRARWVTPRVVHFVAGWSQGRYGAHAIGRSLHVAPGYGAGTGSATLAADWALVALAEALPIRPIPLSAADAEDVPDPLNPLAAAGGAGSAQDRASPQGPSAGPDHSVIGHGARHEIRRAGYSAATAERMTAQDRCSVQLIREPAPLLLHDCRAIPGESGSALLRIEPDGPHVIGLLVARRLEGSGARSLAVPVQSFRAEAERMLADSTRPPSQR